MYKAMVLVTRENNFIYFTLALVALLLASAVVDSMPDDSDLMVVEGLILVTQIVAFTSLDFGRRWRWFVALSFLLILGANLLRRFSDWDSAPVTALCFMLVFYLGVAANVARSVLFRDRVTMNIVVGAMAIYLLLGLIWATVYLLVMDFFPHALHGIEHKYWGDNFSRALYYSYVTMTTVGYGDITPAIPLTRTLAYLQAIVGTFYMAVVVASLIGSRQHRHS